MNTHQEGISSSVVEALSRGDKASFESIFWQYRTFLYQYALRFVKDQQIAEEIMQDAFIKLWLNRSRLNPHLSLKAYLQTITRNLVYDYLKKVASEQRLQREFYVKMQKRQNVTEDKVVHSDYEQLTQQIIDKLPAQKRKIFTMSREQGLTHEEIAEALNLSPKTVNNHMTQALHTIREYLTLHMDITLVTPIMLYILTAWL